MKINTIYEKSMSQIMGLQQESKTKYGIVETQGGCDPVYGILVICEKDGISFSDMIQFISTSKTAVGNILTYLYENAVVAELCRNVVSDLVPESM